MARELTLSSGGVEDVTVHACSAGSSRAVQAVRDGGVGAVREASLVIAAEGEVGDTGATGAEGSTSAAVLDIAERLSTAVAATDDVEASSATGTSGGIVFYTSLTVGDLTSRHTGATVRQKGEVGVTNSASNFVEAGQTVGDAGLAAVDSADALAVGQVNAVTSTTNARGNAVLAVHIRTYGLTNGAVAAKRVAGSAAEASRVGICGASSAVND